MRVLLVALLAGALATGAQAAEYVAVPGGTFDSVLPQGPVPTMATPVAVAPFAMRTLPVTVGEFAAFARRHPEWQRGQAPAVMADARYLLGWQGATEPGSAIRADAPVTEVSWFAAQAYCEE